MENFAIKAAIARAIRATIWPGTADNALKYVLSILAVPGGKVMRLHKRVKKISPRSSKEILPNRELTDLDKIELLKKKIKLKNNEFSKERQFFIFLVAIMFWKVDGNSTLLIWIWTGLKELVGEEDDGLDIADIPHYMIDIFRVYNTSLRKEV